MKRIFKIFKALTVLFIASLLPLAGCGRDRYDLTETDFFLVMSNMLYYPEQYLGKEISLDCFVYEIDDAVTNEHFVCGVRKCSSGYGCTCGNDTIIGFILDYDGEIPKAKNQSEDTTDKSWIHIAGGLVNAEKSFVNVYSYVNGEKTDKTEQIYFYRFAVQTLSEIDGSNLQYYVTR